MCILYVYMCIYIYMCVCVYKYGPPKIYLLLFQSTLQLACIQTCVCVCVCVFVYIYIYIHMYTYEVAPPPPSFGVESLFPWNA